MLDGNVHLTGEQGQRWVFANTVTSGGLELLRDYLLTSPGSTPPTSPSFIAVGSGNASFGTFGYMTAVPGEVDRAPIIQRDTSGFSVTYHAFLDRNVALNQTISYFGLYAGTAATATVGTGTLVAIASGIPFNKNATNTYKVDWTLTLSGVTH